MRKRKVFWVLMALVLAQSMLVVPATANETAEVESELTELAQTPDESDEITVEEVEPNATLCADDEVVVADENETNTPLVDKDEQDATSLVTAAQTEAPSVRYRAHVQGKGWKKEVADGAVGGTTGKGLRVEALKVRLDGKGTAIDGGIEYRAFVQKKGWQKWKRNGAVGGTTGKGLRVEAIRLKLYGDVAEQYDVWYRVHVGDVGWMAWTSNGQKAGTSGSSLRIEAFEIRLAPKGQRPSDLKSSDTSFAFKKNYKKGGVSVRANMQNRGWLKAVGSGGTAGLAGEGLRVEALRLSLSNYSKGIKYRAYVQNKGWQGWKKDGKTAGTIGKGRRVEAFQIKLYGEAKKHYNVYYRAYAEGIGWMAWTKNGKTAGTQGLALRIEAIQVRLVNKSSSAKLPSSSYKGAVVNATIKKPSNMSIKLVPELAHGYKSPYYQRCIVMHDTTENRGFDYWIQNWIDRGGSGTQFMVNEKGEIRQYVDMNQICWHAGGPTYSWLDQKFNVVKHRADAGSAMNQCSIGIEIDHVEDGRPYPAAQLDAIDRLVKYIDQYYGFKATILQHKDYKLDNSDCSDEFQGYLKHLQRYRTTR